MLRGMDRQSGKERDSVTVGHWSAKRALGPGGGLTLEADYEIKK